MDLSKLALAGLLAVSGPALATPPAQDAPADAPADTTKAEAGGHAEVHDCAGKNVCKGMGGCKVSEDSLKKMAETMGVDAAAAGDAHDCKGLNACKGLGGCSVDVETAQKLKEKMAEGEKQEG